MVTDSARAYRKLPSLFLVVPSLTPYGLPFPPKWGFHMPPPYANGHISATGDPIHFMFGSRKGFRGRRIERRYLRFEQIQDGGRRHLEKISNGHMSATGRPIHFMFGSRWGFRGRRIYWRYFLFDSNKFKMAAAAILDNFERPYLRNGSRSTYIARIARSSLR